MSLETMRIRKRRAKSGGSGPALTDLEHRYRVATISAHGEELAPAGFATRETAQAAVDLNNARAMAGMRYEVRDLLERIQ